MDYLDDDSIKILWQTNKYWRNSLKDELLRKGLAKLNEENERMLMLADGYLCSYLKKEETDTDIKGKQERNMENEIKSEIKKDIETEREGKDGKENERSMPPVPSNSVFQASPVVVESLSLDKSIGKETVSEGMQAGGGSEAILLLNMQTIGIRNEQTVKAIVALARRKELGGPGGILWKILSSQ